MSIIKQILHKLALIILFHQVLEANPWFEHILNSLFMQRELKVPLMWLHWAMHNNSGTDHRRHRHWEISITQELRHVYLYCIVLWITQEIFWISPFHHNTQTEDWKQTLLWQWLKYPWLFLCHLHDPPDSVARLSFKKFFFYSFASSIMLFERFPGCASKEA